MKQLIKVTKNDQTLTTVSRVVRNGVVIYRNTSFLVSESSGTYAIDITRPLQKVIDIECDDEILAKAYRILEARHKQSQCRIFLESPDSVKNLFLLRHTGLVAEQFDVAFLSNRHTLLEIRTMFKGTIDSASVYPREVLRACIETNAAAVCFGHNHPSGDPSPSRADKTITEKLRKLLSLVDCRVLDHIVTGDGHAISLAELGDI